MLWNKSLLLLTADSRKVIIKRSHHLIRESVFAAWFSLRILFREIIVIMKHQIKQYFVKHHILNFQLAVRRLKYNDTLSNYQKLFNLVQAPYSNTDVPQISTKSE